MSVTIDITGLPPERIGFAVSPLAELGLALHALSEPGHHPGLHGWVTATAAALKPDLADRLHEGEFLWRNTFSDVFMPFAGIPGWDGTPGSTLAEDLDLLDRLPDERFASAALEITCSSLCTVKTPSPLCDPAMPTRALERRPSGARGRWTSRGGCWSDPDSMRAWLRRLFEDCDQAFFGGRLAAGPGPTGRRRPAQGGAAAPQGARRGRAPRCRPPLSLDDGGTRISVDKLSEGRRPPPTPSPAPARGSPSCPPRSAGPT